MKILNTKQKGAKITKWEVETTFMSISDTTITQVFCNKSQGMLKNLC